MHTEKHILIFFYIFFVEFINIYYQLALNSMEFIHIYSKHFLTGQLKYTPNTT